MTITELPHVTEISYAELIDQLQMARDSDFPAGSTFWKPQIPGKEYWFVQQSTGPQGRPSQRYLGAVTPEVDARPAAGKQQKNLVNMRPYVSSTPRQLKSRYWGA